MGLDPVESYDRRHAEEMPLIPYSPCIMEEYWENGAFVSDDAFADPFDAHGDPVVGGLFLEIMS